MIIGGGSACAHWTVILGFFQHLRSRNQMDMLRKVYRAVQLAKQRTKSFSWMTAKNASGGEKTVGVVSWVNAEELIVVALLRVSR